jgi:N-acetylmuramoyl-L-alanine amidase
LSGAVTRQAGRTKTIGGLALGGLAAFVLVLIAGSARGGAAEQGDERRALLGEARRGEVTVPIEGPVPGVRVHEARVAGRPIVLIDAGHGGRDPGATSVSGAVTEKALTLALATELRDALVRRGRVRVAMTRVRDDYLTLEQRAGIARRLGASLFLSIHMDSAPNPLARGASVYSLSDVASDAEAARFAAIENRAGGPSGERNDVVGALLSDLALRSQMNASAELASRLVRKASGRIALRPEPHRFASFHVLRSSGTSAVLFEAGYISNVDDEVLLRAPAHRAPMVSALADAIEADVAARTRR